MKCLKPGRQQQRRFKCDAVNMMVSLSSLSEEECGCRISVFPHKHHISCAISYWLLIPLCSISAPVFTF